MKNPIRDMPRAIYISIPLVSIVYVLVNVSYMTIISPDLIKVSDAVAVVSIDIKGGSIYEYCNINHRINKI